MNDQSVPWRYITIFCLLTSGLFWIPFFGSILAEDGDSAAGIWKTLFGIIGPYSPLIAAVITRILIAREGFRDAHLRIRGVPWYYWGLALLLPAFWNGVQDLLQLWLGFTAIDWSKVPDGLYRIPINLFGGILIFIGEEFGWRSYLLEKLRPLSRWRALFVSGAVWSLWHTPLLLIPNPYYGPEPEPLGVILALLIFLLMGFIFGWLYFESKSVWPGVLMHSYNNLIGFKLLSEAWTVNSEPTLLQNSLMAIGPILVVWLILYLKGKYKNPIR